MSADSWVYVMRSVIPVEGQCMRILYEDSVLVVIDKPGGMLSVPGRGPERQDSVVTRLRQTRTSCIAQPAVHRLDMDTSGLMVLGLTRESHRLLSEQFAQRTVEKEYLALLEGLVALDEGEIVLPFRLDPENRPYQIYDPVHGKWGISTWRKLKVQGKRTLVLFGPVTGRTHQLRLHASHPLGLGCPIVGDRLYGFGESGESLMLHATRLRFRHPESGTMMEFFSPAPFCCHDFEA